MEKPSSSRLERLIAKRKAIDEQIRAANEREREIARKQDTRRKILAGAVVLEEAEKRPEFRQELTRLLDRFLARPDDRKLFNLAAAAAPGTVVGEASAVERIEQAADAIEAGIRAA